MAADGYDAVVVGAGPNGLAGAVTLAQAGWEVLVLEAADTIGGGTRTAELTLPGLRHDVCSAVHPFGVASPFFTSLDLAQYGLEWCWPEVQLAHPLDGGRAGVLYRSLEETVQGLGEDGRSWQKLFSPVVEHFDDVMGDALRPLLHLPRHPITMARFGTRAALPVTTLAGRFHGQEAPALLGGSAAHMMVPLHHVMTSSVGVMLTAAAHRHGWPVAAGGSSAITDALARLLVDLGGTIETGVTVRSLDAIAPARVVLLDTSPTAAASIIGARLPSRVARAYGRWRYGPASFKLDLAVEGGVPWANAACRRAGTLHVIGSFDELVHAEAMVAAGKMPERPFVLVAQQYLADPSRSVGDTHPVWVYAHVPSGFEGDATDAVLDQLERFAPGVRDRIVAVHTTGPGDFARYNANYVNGDIATGAADLRQLIGRPRFALNPYATGVDGVYLCSSASPPGPGVHGMCGHFAARMALRAHRR